MSKVVILSVLISVALVAVPSLLFDFGDWAEFFIRIGFGFFFGLLIAPEIDKNVFNFPVAFQSVSGFFCGVILAYMLDVTIGWVAVSAMIGLSAGFTARWWVKEIRHA